MPEATKLQALWSWLLQMITGKALAFALLAIALTVGLVWMSGDDNSQPDTDATVHGDGIASGRDVVIDGDVTFK